MREFLSKFDNTGTAWIQSWPAWLHGTMLAITNVGQPLTVIVFATGVLIWSLREQKEHMAIASLIVLLTVIVSSGLKVVLRRARPATEYVAKMLYHTFSFPSGHAASATVGFGFLAYLVWGLLPQPWAAIIAAFIAIFITLICVSRIYLGAHYPTDIVGGVILGVLGLGVIVVMTPLT